jgi:hypothetical protein
MVGATHIHQHEARRRILILRPPARRHCARRTPRIHKELALHLVRLELVRAAPQQHVDVHLAGCNQQTVAVARRHNRMSMCKADAQRAVRHDLGQREVGRLDVEVAFYDLQVRRDGAQELVGVAVGDVSEAEDLADFAGREEFLELEAW